MGVTESTATGGSLTTSAEVFPSTVDRREPSNRTARPLATRVQVVALALSPPAETVQIFTLAGTCRPCCPRHLGAGGWDPTPEGIGVGIPRCQYEMQAKPARILSCSLKTTSLLALLALVSATPAVAETWVTVATMPYRRIEPNNIVAYQIDAASLFKKGQYAYAKGKFDYQRKSESLVANCSMSRLKVGADRVFPPPYWIRRVNGRWLFDDEGSSTRGNVWEDPSEPAMRRWMNGVLGFMCG